MKNIEIARFELNADLEKNLEKLMNGDAKDFDLLTSFGPVTEGGSVYIFFVFQKIQ